MLVNGVCNWYGLPRKQSKDDDSFDLFGFIFTVSAIGGTRERERGFTTTYCELIFQGSSHYKAYQILYSYVESLSLGDVTQVLDRLAFTHQVGILDSQRF